MEPFTPVERTQFRDASLTLAGDNYPKNAEMTCDLPIYFTEEMETVGAGENAREQVKNIYWVRTVNLQDLVTKTDDGKMLNSWTAEYSDDAQQPDGVEREFIEHRDALEGFDNCELMKINCDFLTNSKGMLENHLKKFHNIILKQVGGGNNAGAGAGASAGAGAVDIY